MRLKLLPSLTDETSRCLVPAPGYGITGHAAGRDGGHIEVRLGIRNPLSYDLVEFIAQENLGAGVPRQHAAAGVENDDGVVDQIIDKCHGRFRNSRRGANCDFDNAKFKPACDINGSPDRDRVGHFPGHCSRSEGSCGSRWLSRLPDYESVTPPNGPAQWSARCADPPMWDGRWIGEPDAIYAGACLVEKVPALVVGVESPDGAE